MTDASDHGLRLTRLCGAHVRGSRSTSASPSPTGPSLGEVRHRELPQRPRRRGAKDGKWYEGGGAATDRAVQNITIYPPTAGVQTQGDPFEPVKIGILIDMDLNQLLADWIDPTILAIEDAMNEGIWARSPVQLVIADARGLPRENHRKVHRGLSVAGRAGVRRRARPDDLGQLPRDPGHRERGRGAVHRLDRRPPLRVRLLLHGGQRRHPDRGRDVRASGCSNRVTARSACSGRPGSSGRDYADYFRYTAMQLGLTITREVMLEPNPRRPRRRPAPRCGRWAPRRSTTAATATATFHFAAAFRRARVGSAPGHGHGVHVLFELERVGRGPGGLARRRPARRGRRQPELQRDDPADAARFGRIDPQRRGRARLRHRKRGDPRHRQRRHPRAALGQGGHGAHPLDAGTNGGPGCTSSSGPTTARATRATSSRSASSATASCASTATTAPNGPRTTGWSAPRS